jgi:F0F1-type ATP synthase membrane subunit c/vacuolar-type H+-ATPase subunit K
MAGREGTRRRRYAQAALALAAGVLAGLAALAVDVRPEHLAAGLAIGFAGLAGIGKRAAP